MKQICTLYSPDPNITPTTLKAEIRSIQSGYTDCGVFAIAYAVEIAHGYDPASVIFDQSKMRNHLHHCLTSKTLTRFPKKQQCHQQTSFTDITSNFPQHLKWESSSKPARHQTAKSLLDFRTQNRLNALTPDTQHSQTTTQHPHKDSTATITPPKKLIDSSESLICNLSKWSLSKIEKSVLELGLTFCPSQKNFNKEQLTLDFFHFIRRLKLREVFSKNPTSDYYDDQNMTTPNDERSTLNWINRNSEWHPDKVKNN